MLDQLPGWLQVIIGGASLILSLLGACRLARRKSRRLKLTCFRLGAMSYVRLDVTDHSQS